MGKTYYYLYKEQEVIDDAEHTVFECARWQIYRSVLTSVIGGSTIINIVVVKIRSRENFVSVVSYVKRILRLKKRDFEPAEHVAEHAGSDDTGTLIRQNAKQGPGRKE